MTDKYGSTLQIGAEVIFVTNANTAPYIEVGRVTNIYGDACTIKKQWEKPSTYLFPQDHLSGSD